MHPGFKSRIEKLEPVIANLKHDGFTQEKVFVSETCRNSPEIEKISGKREARQNIETDIKYQELGGKLKPNWLIKSTDKQ